MVYLPLLDDVVDFRHALTSGGTNAHVIFDQAGAKGLGIFDGTFIASGYNATSLTPGWHHSLPVVQAGIHLSGRRCICWNFKW